MAYRFDNDSKSFMEVTTSFARRLWRFLWWLAGSLAISGIAYVLMSLFVNTEQEKRLMRENRMYEKMYGDMVERLELIGDVTEGLQARDHEIYDDIFHTKAPSLDPIASVDLVMFSDTASEESRVSRTAARLADLSRGADMVERNFMEIFSILSSAEVGTVPPMAVPIHGITYAQADASVGQKFNPFYKIETQHDGFDIIAAEGSRVSVTADGIVIEVSRSRKGLGNVVTVDHENGYVTRYAHLSDIFVSRGQRLRRGDRVGNVGISGSAFAPHLHYEVLRNGIPVDPTNFMFGDLGPGEYANVAFMSSRTGRSLD